MKKVICLSVILISLSTILFGQATSETNSIVQFLSAIKDKDEFMMNQIIQREVDTISTAGSDSPKQSSEIKLKILYSDRNIYELYNMIRINQDKLIVGIETYLLVTNCKLKNLNKERNSENEIEVDSIKKYDNLFKLMYDEYFLAQKSSNKNNSSLTSLFPSTILPDPLDLLNAFVSLLENNRDYRAQQIQSFNAILEGLKLSSIADIQNGNSGSSSSSNGDSSGSSKSKGGKKS